MEWSETAQEQIQIHYRWNKNAIFSGWIRAEDGIFNRTFVHGNYLGELAEAIQLRTLKGRVIMRFSYSFVSGFSKGIFPPITTKNTSSLESQEPYELIPTFLIAIKVRSLATLFPTSS